MKSKQLKLISTVILFFSTTVLGGCAQMAVKKALRQYEQQLNPAIGRMKKDDYIKSWGPPQSTTPVSDGQVCVWRFSYGTRAFAGGSQYAVNASAHEMYDQLTLTFDENGTLQTWRANCQR